MAIVRTFAAAVGFLLATAFVTQVDAQSMRDRNTEEANRKLVVEFHDKVFNEHAVTEGAKVIADDYKQHNPKVPDGKAPFVKFFTGLFKDNPNVRSRIVRSAADGDLVWIHSHATKNAEDRGLALIDIFRVKDGKIVEHWDVMQPVPEESANTNTMF